MVYLEGQRGISSSVYTFPSQNAQHMRVGELHGNLENCDAFNNMKYAKHL